MKTNLFRLILGGSATLCAAVTLNVFAAPPSGYHLAWSDEFDGFQLADNAF